MTRLIVAINVHEKPNFLVNQVLNLRQYIILDCNIVLSCNSYMYAELSKLSMPGVFLNPVIIEKNRYHGSLTHGIVSNMKYSLRRFLFDYFIVLSSRDLFYNYLRSSSQIESNSVPFNSDNSDYIDFNLPRIYSEGKYCSISDPVKYIHWEYNQSGFIAHNLWWWPSFQYTLLYQFIVSRRLKFSHSMHEGLCFGYESCDFILFFLDHFPSIEFNLYNYYGCVEEFSLQSICVQFSNYYYLGNGCETLDFSKLSSGKFTHKVVR